MTISFRPIANFDSLSYEKAQSIVYKDLLPTCEKIGVYLSQEGNLNCPQISYTGNFYSPVEEYTCKKTSQELLNVERIQMAFHVLDQCVQETGHFQPAARSGIQRVWSKIQGSELSYGEFVAAMLIKGYQARFARRGDPLNRTCEFRAEAKTELDLKRP